jgi:hypothetical protein
MRRVFVDVEDEAVMNQTAQPFLVSRPVPRLRNAVAILSQHNHWNCHLIGTGENRNDRGISVSRRR